MKILQNLVKGVLLSVCLFFSYHTCFAAYTISSSVKDSNGLQSSSTGYSNLSAGGQSVIGNSSNGYNMGVGYVYTVKSSTSTSNKLANTPWPMFRQNLYHTGASTIPVSGTTGELKWRYQTIQSIYSSPAIGSDGTVYVGSNDNYLYAICSTGTIKWSYQTGSYVYSSPAIGSDGTVYILSSDNYLYAICSTGTIKWRYLTVDGGSDCSSPAIDPEGTIYVGGTDNYLRAICSTGTLKWSYQIGNAVQSSPAIGSNGTVYVGGQDYYLYAICSSGTLKWRYLTGGQLVDSSPAISWFDGTIYVGSSDNYLYAICSTGTIKWKYQTGGSVRSSPAIGSDGTVCVGSGDNYLYAICSTGTIKWKYQTGSGVYSSPAIGSDGTVYVGSDDNYLYAICSTGTIKWKYQTGNYDVRSSPAIGSDGTVYVGSYDHYLYAIQTNNPSGAPALRRARANPDFILGEVYSFPNPAKRGKWPTIHIECGIADSVEIRMYNIAAEPVGSVKLSGLPQIINGKYAYEQTWDVSNIASGVYIYAIKAKKSGYSDIKAQGKAAIIK